MRRADFARVTQCGRRVSTRYFLVFVERRDDQVPARLGITVTRKVGNAVRRNRIKRLVREWFRLRSSVLGSVDLVVIARRDMPRDVSQVLANVDLDGLLEPASP